MSFEPSAKQQVLLWRLVVSQEDGEFLKHIEGNIPPAERKPLVREGLIEEGKRKSPETGRPAIYLELTDKGWACCQSLLDSETEFTPSKLTGSVLRRFLGLMNRYFESQDQTASIGQFVHQTRSPSNTGSKSSENGRDLEQSIQSAYFDASGGKENVRVRLAQIRSRLNDVSRSSLDEKLLELEQAGRLSLYHLDNPGDIQAEDRAAVLKTATGQERHVMYWGGNSQ